MPTKQTTALVWNDARECLPDDDTTVIVGFGDGETEHGFFSGGTWRSMEQVAFGSPVEFWADCPEVPVRGAIFAPELRFVFPSEAVKKEFANYLCDGGGSDTFCQLAEEEGLPSLEFNFHGVEDERYPRDDKRRYGKFLCDDTIRVVICDEQN